MFSADLVTVTEEIFIGKLHFLGSVIQSDNRYYFLSTERFSWKIVKAHKRHFKFERL